MFATATGTSGKVTFALHWEGRDVVDMAHLCWFEPLHAAWVILTPMPRQAFITLRHLPLFFATKRTQLPLACGVQVWPVAPLQVY